MKRLVLLLAVPACLSATTPRVVTWSEPTLELTPTRNVGQAVIHLRATVARGWHMYSLTQPPGGPRALAFGLETASGYSLGPPAGPRADRAYDAQFDMTTETYSGSPSFNIPFRWTAAARAGKLNIVVRYQACSDKLCLPPRKEVLPLNVTP